MFQIGDRVVLQSRFPVSGTVTYVMPDSIRIMFDSNTQRDIDISDSRLVCLA